MDISNNQWIRAYTEGNTYTWEDEYAKCVGILRFGEWPQDGSGGEYSPISCVGWYIEVISVTHTQFSTPSEDNPEVPYYPNYYRKQSIKELEKNVTFKKLLPESNCEA